MKVPQTRFNIPAFYGDIDWHVVNHSSYPIQTANPFGIYIGITTEVNPSLGTFTKLQSNWLWRHTFGSRNSSNFWSSNAENGSNGSIAITNLGIGYNGGYTNVGAGNVVEECYITTGSIASVKSSLLSIQFSSYNDWYFTPSIPSYPNLAENSAIVARFKQSYIADLPTEMYTINNRTITWNLSHPVCILLYGQDCFTA